jgi:thiamine pyrophosphate-dependent acetolactate synthase large subunit-like protein
VTRWEIWREEKRSRLKDDRGKGLNSASVFAALSEAVPSDAVIAVDVGNNTYSFGRYFESQGQRILMSGYLGSIGFSFSAAMGVVKYDMDITHVLLNNSELGKISKEQRAWEWPVWQTALHNPSFSAYAKLCGGHGIRVTKVDAVASGARRGARSQGPSAGRDHYRR